MILIGYGKWRRKPTKESVAQASKLFEQFAKEGGKIIGQYWTLGKYDVTTIIEAKDEKAAMKFLLRWGDILSLETATAIPREEAIKLLE
jgi:uncharacterized protein with GYD domain